MSKFTEAVRLMDQMDALQERAAKTRDKLRRCYLLMEMFGEGIFKRKDAVVSTFAYGDRQKFIFVCRLSHKDTKEVIEDFECALEDIPIELWPHQCIVDVQRLGSWSKYGKILKQKLAEKEKAKCSVNP